MKIDIGISFVWVLICLFGIKILRICCIGVDLLNYLLFFFIMCIEGIVDYNMKVCLICYMVIYYIDVYKINICKKD